MANTTLALSDVNTYVKIANEAHVDFEVVAIHGNHQNVHNVPEETLEKMRAKMIDYPGETVINTDIYIYIYSL